jgi:hypothetical protein
MYLVPNKSKGEQVVGASLCSKNQNHKYVLSKLQKIILKQCMKFMWANFTTKHLALLIHMDQNVQLTVPS